MISALRRGFCFENMLTWTVLTIALVCFFVPFHAYGANGVTVDFGSDWPIEAKNLAPGETVKRNFSVLNSRSESMILSLYLNRTFSSSLTNPLEEKLIVQIKRPDGSFSQLPNGNSFQPLAELLDYTGPNGQRDFPFDTIPGKASNPLSYEFWITFDLSSGNEYQSKEIVFSLSAKITAQIEPKKKKNGGGDENDNSDSIISRIIQSGNNSAGSLGELADSGVPTVGSGSAVIGEIQGEESGGMVAGDENCRTLPFWVWALGILTLAFLLIFSLSYRFKTTLELRWFLETVYVALAIGAWYILDICRLYTWFPTVALLTGAGIYLSYLHEYNMKMKRRYR